jgi:hypothetical protein
MTVFKSPETGFSTIDKIKFRFRGNVGKSSLTEMTHLKKILIAIQKMQSFS